MEMEFEVLKHGGAVLLRVTGADTAPVEWEPVPGAATAPEVVSSSGRDAAGRRISLFRLPDGAEICFPSCDGGLRFVHALVSDGRPFIWYPVFGAVEWDTEKLRQMSRRVFSGDEELLNGEVDGFFGSVGTLQTREEQKNWSWSEKDLDWEWTGPVPPDDGMPEEAA